MTGPEATGRQLPDSFRGIDSDNDSVFIDKTLAEYCAHLASNSPVTLPGDATGIGKGRDAGQMVTN